MKENNEVMNDLQIENTTQFTDEQHEIYVTPDTIAGYIIRRSPTSRLHYNVYATDSKDELLFCAASDLSAEKAMAIVDALNEKYYPYLFQFTLKNGVTNESKRHKET